MRSRAAFFLGAAVWLGSLSCQNLWTTNLLEPLDNPILPKSGEMANWGIDEFRSRMISRRWVSAVINDATLGQELQSRLSTLAGNAATKVEASLLWIRALMNVKGVPECTDRVVTYLFPELINSGLLSTFDPTQDASTQALRNLLLALIPFPDTASRTRVLEAYTGIHTISANFLSVIPPGIDWYGSASLEELGEVAQAAVGAGLVFALMSVTIPSTYDADKVIAFMNSNGQATDLSANFDVPPASPNIASNLQDLFQAMNKNANNTNPLFEHLERIGDLLPF